MWTEGFRNASGVKCQSVAGIELAFLHFAIPFLESAENGGGGTEPVKGVIRTQKQCGEMAAVDVTQTASCIVILGKEKRGEGTARRSEERRVGKEGRSRWSPYH